MGGGGGRIWWDKKGELGFRDGWGGVGKREEGGEGWCRRQEAACLEVRARVQGRGGRHTVQTYREVELSLEFAFLKSLAF